MGPNEIQKLFITIHKKVSCRLGEDLMTMRDTMECIGMFGNTSFDDTQSSADITKDFILKMMEG